MIQGMRRLVFLCSILVVLEGCKDTARSGYLELGGRIFIFNPRVATAVYAVSFSILKNIPEGSTLVVTFENPAGGAALITRQPVGSLDTKIGVQSEALQCVKEGRAYAFSAQLLDSTGRELQVLTSSITSTLDQSVLPEAPLVVGPGYAPNTQLKRDSSGKFMRTKPQSCPA